jgi:hypothetical protein
MRARGRRAVGSNFYFYFSSGNLAADFLVVIYICRGKRQATEGGHAHF